MLHNSNYVKKLMKKGLIFGKFPLSSACFSSRFLCASGAPYRGRLVI